MILFFWHLHSGFVGVQVRVEWGSGNPCLEPASFSKSPYILSNGAGSNLPQFQDSINVGAQFKRGSETYELQVGQGLVKSIWIHCRSEWKNRTGLGRARIQVGPIVRIWLKAERGFCGSGDMAETALIWTNLYEFVSIWAVWNWAGLSENSAGVKWGEPGWDWANILEGNWTWEDHARCYDRVP